MYIYIGREVRMIIVCAYFLLPASQSLLSIVGSHKILVGGNKSSWKYAVFTLGTVKVIGSIVVLHNLNALANSTWRTSHTFFDRNENPWCNPGGLYGDRANKCGASVDTSNVTTVLSPYDNVIHK